MILAKNARRFQTLQRILAWELLTLRAACVSEPVMDAVYTAVVGTARTRALDAGSDREDRSSDVCHAGDTRQSFSEHTSGHICSCRELNQQKTKTHSKNQKNIKETKKQTDEKSKTYIQKQTMIKL